MTDPVDSPSPAAPDSSGVAVLDRAFALLAAFGPGDDRLTLTATRGEMQYGICSTAFLEHAFRTDSYRIEILFDGEDAWSYDIKTMLMVRGRTELFEHHDRNRLKRIGAAKPNPLMQIMARRAASTTPA